jgi:S-adenosylmethionine:tRNA ribosyltransferase-isomerase
MQLSDFHYHLPAHLIAQYPLAERSASRLLVTDKADSGFKHLQFKQIIDLIEPGDLLIFNNTKVIPARLFGTKTTGGAVEVLVERIIDDSQCLVQMRVSKAPKVGDVILFALGIKLQIVAKQGHFYQLQSSDSQQSIISILAAIGQIPLPPYMKRAPETEDLARYQTIYAENQGSVAAPTAGLHFDHKLMTALQAKGVRCAFLTLHIGAGTFMPVRTDNIKEHRMHAEWMQIDLPLCQRIKTVKAAGGRVIAVGTTSLRALETASVQGDIAPYQGDTDIFIYPGFNFHCVDALITNFHLPGSTLLMLVSAFGGYQHMLAAYQEAVKESYRFYSYGDAMFITCPNP